jgi:hypothetical protein
MMGYVESTVSVRHPLDPEPGPATKSRAVFVLGLVGLLTGALVGGVVPATVALLLARQAQREAYAARGYLTGAAWVRRGQWLAWAGIVLACASLVMAAIVGLLHLAGAADGHDFDSTTS